MHLCKFSGDHFDALTGRDKRDYDRVKAAVLADGGFSAFSATETASVARIFDRMNVDPEIEFYDRRYPWISVRKREVKR